MEREQNSRSERTRDTEVTREKDLVPKAGLYKGGLLKSLIGAAIPLLHIVSSLSPLCISLSLSVSIQPGLCTRLTLY